MKKRQIILFCVLTVLFWGGQYMYVPTLTPYSKSIGASVMMLGLIGGSYGLMQFLFRIPIGLGSDLLRKRKPSIVLGISFVALSGLCFLLLNSPAGILLARSLSGIAASFWAVYAVMFASYFHDQVKGIGILSAFNSIGVVTATLFGGVISQFFGTRAPFFCSVVLGCVGMLIALLLREKESSVPNKTLKELLEIRHEKSVLFCSLLGILLQFVSFGTAYVFTPLVAKNIGAGDTQLGILTFLFTLPGVFASLLIGSRLFRKIGFKIALGISFLLLAFASFPVALVRSLPALYILQFAGGFGRGIIYTGLLSMVVISVPAELKATATGFYQAAYALGMFLGPVFTGAISDGSSLLIPYAVMGLIGLLAAMIAILLYDRMYASNKLQVENEN